MGVEAVRGERRAVMSLSKEAESNVNAAPRRAWARTGSGIEER